VPGLLGDVDLALLEALDELLRGEVHQLDLIGPAQELVGDILPHQDPGDLGHHIPEALQVLHIEGGEDINARVQEIPYVLPALGVQSPGGVGVGQVVHEDDLGVTGQGPLQIELLQGRPPVGIGLPGQQLQARRHGLGLGAPVGVHQARHHIRAVQEQGLGLHQHGVGLADARGGTEEYLQSGPGLPGL